MQVNSNVNYKVSIFFFCLQYYTVYFMTTKENIALTLLYRVIYECWKYDIMKKTMLTDKDNNDEILETNNESDDDVQDV